MALVQPLDLYTIFVNYFAGSMEIFFATALIFFAFIAAKYRIPNTIFLMLMTLFIILMGGLGEVSLLYVIAMFVIGLVVYFIIAKPIKS